tara:strand:- start:4904 stop:5665 length:762 start_codon:yes stop_codon:yes gene_type:complete
MVNQTTNKKQTATAFGSRSNSYLISKNHKEGSDLDILSNWSTESRFILDIATGAGHAANAISQNIPSRTIATDISPKMVRTAISAYPSLEGVISDAECLPFQSSTFDTIVCRIAAHHFPNPLTFLSEVARISAKPAIFLFEDNVAPTLPSLNTFLNKVEKLRDPTHIESYTENQWKHWIEEQGFTIEYTLTLKKNIEYLPWIRQSNTPPGNIEKLNDLFINAPPAAKKLFDIQITNGVVDSFSNLKILIKAIR